VYAHNLTNFVEVGDTVAAGQVIGQVGRSGRASNYHLHFEIRHDGVCYNPLYLLPASAPSPRRLLASHDTWPATASIMTMPNEGDTLPEDLLADSPKSSSLARTVSGVSYQRYR
jgi:Peptidase family M23